MADPPITELVVSPRWAVSVGNIDGIAHVVLRIEHPRLGPLDFLLPDNDAIELAAALEKTWERRDERRMQSTTVQPRSEAQIAELRPAALASWWLRFRRSGTLVTSKFTSQRVSATGDRRAKGAD